MDSGESKHCSSCLHSQPCAGWSIDLSVSAKTVNSLDENRQCALILDRITFLRGNTKSESHKNNPQIWTIKNYCCLKYYSFIWTLFWRSMESVWLRVERDCLAKATGLKWQGRLQRGSSADKLHGRLWLGVCCFLTHLWGFCQIPFLGCGSPSCSLWQ
jgi:hypothetical protein